MPTYRITQAPGQAALRRRERLAEQGDWISLPPPKRVAVVDASNDREALVRFLVDRYPEGHAQFVEARLMWSGSGASGRTWREDDGNTKSGRFWKAIVLLRNGGYEHETTYSADRHDGRWDRR